MARTKIVSVGNQFPYGRQRVGTLAPSTGPYGKHVAGRPSSIAVKIRRGRR